MSRPVLSHPATLRRPRVVWSILALVASSVAWWAGGGPAQAERPRQADPRAEAERPRPEIPLVRADMSVRAGLYELTDSYGGAVEDFDADGDPDFFLGTHNHPARLYRNDGGTFTDVAGGTFPDRDRHGCSWGDPNVDGLPDVYCTIGADHGTGEPKANELWIQQSDGTFEDRSPEFGVEDPYGRGRHAVFLDVNHDPYPDLFVLNKAPRDDGLPTPNRLFINVGGVWFRSAPEYRLDREEGGDQHCLQAADVNGDGWDDLLVCGRRRLALYLNFKGQWFADATESMGIFGGWSDAELRDMNGDDKLDLLRIGRGRFEILLQRRNRFELTYSLELEQGWSLATGDVDGDTNLDVFLLQECRRPAMDIPDIVLLGDGTRTGYTVIELFGAESGCGESVAAIDHDANGLADFIVLNGARAPDGSQTAGPVQLITHHRCTIVGGRGEDRLLGTPHDDVICGRGGDDRIRSIQGGHDILSGGGGDDVLEAGPGWDILLGGGDMDYLVARDRNSGNDVVDGEAGGARCLADAEDLFHRCRTATSESAARGGPAR